MRGWFLTILLLVVSGCGQKGGGGDTKFLLPWHDANGKYELEEVTIETLANPNELRGEAAEVYSHAVFNQDGFDGSIARPHLTKSGNVYIPLDSESATAIAIYAQFDKLFRYERELGSRGQLNWPRRIGIEINMIGSDTFVHNNAHYFTDLDVIGLVPFTKGSAVPVALNHGIVAHEHFHAHFQSQVLNVINLAKSPPVVSALEDMFYPLLGFASKSSAANSKLGTGSPRDMNNLILRAWNEGLADLFAGIYQGQSDFFTPSLPQLKAARNLDADGGRLWNAADLQNLAGRVQLSQDQLTSIAYTQGTVMARLLYHVANAGTESPQAFSARILKRLPNIATKVSGGIATTIMNFEDVLPVLLDDYQLTPGLCTSLNAVLMKSTMQKGFARCGL
jgi:hypothetical protein